VATLCCGIFCWRLRTRRRLPFFSSGVDEEEARFQRRLEAATAGAFEVGAGDDELELTAAELLSIQSLEKELKELRAQKLQGGGLPPAPSRMAPPAQPTGATAPALFAVEDEDGEEGKEECKVVGPEEKGEAGDARSVAAVARP
jgi:hypothetical protein